VEWNILPIGGWGMKDNLIFGHPSKQRDLIHANLWLIEPRGVLTAKPLSRITCRALAFSFFNRNRKVTLKEAAEVAGVSPSQLERKCKEEIGLSFNSWHTGERITLAINRMYLFEETSKEAMLTAGYESFSQFSHTFKSWTGKFPRQFRDDAILGITSLERRMEKKNYLLSESYKKRLAFIHLGRVTESRLAWAEKHKVELLPNTITKSEIKTQDQIQPPNAKIIFQYLLQRHASFRQQMR
jgi:AraC-like DNA-binding protein